MIQFDINWDSIFLDWMFQPSARFISVRFGGSSVQAADSIHILRCSYPSLSSAPRAKLGWKAGSCRCRCPKIFFQVLAVIERAPYWVTGKCCCFVETKAAFGSPFDVQCFGLRFKARRGDWACWGSKTRPFFWTRGKNDEKCTVYRVPIAISCWSSVIWAPFWRFWATCEDQHLNLLRCVAVSQLSIAFQLLSW